MSRNSLFSCSPRNTQAHGCQCNPFNFQVSHHAQRGAILSSNHVFSSHLEHHILFIQILTSALNVCFVATDTRNMPNGKNCSAIAWRHAALFQSFKLCKGLQIFASTADEPDHPQAPNEHTLCNPWHLHRSGRLGGVAISTNLPLHRQTPIPPSWKHASRTCPLSSALVESRACPAGYRSQNEDSSC